MQSFVDLFASNRILAIGVLLGAIVVILLVGIALVRLVFGRRLHMSSGRTRQPRLGVVDAFDLDRQRQLVLVRRDNVEHLLMIGGPNDVVIETAIVRAALAPAALSARENGMQGQSIAISAPAPQVPIAPPMQAGASLAVANNAPAPVAEPRPQPQSAAIAVPMRAPEPMRVPEPARAPVLREPPNLAVEMPSSEPAPLPPPPAEIEARPPQPGAPPPPSPRGFPPVSQFPRTAPIMPSKPPSPGPRPLPTSPAPGPAPRPPVSRATPLPPGRTQPAMAEPNPSSRVEPASPPVAPPRHDSGGVAPEAPNDRSNAGMDSGAARRALPLGPRELGQGTPPPRVDAANGPAMRDQAAKDQPAPSPPPTMPGVIPPRPQQVPRTPSSRSFETLGSLEEEMAKLLGRPVPPSDRSGS